MCDSFDFSISHSCGVVAVAISESTVGIDVEQVKNPSSDRFADRMLSASELFEYNKTDESKKARYLIGKWSEKEAIFKSKNKSAFIPSEAKACEYENLFTYDFSVKDVEFVCSVLAAKESKIEIDFVDFEDI